MMNDNDSNCCRTLSLNHPSESERIVRRDMSDLDLSTHRPDLLMGGIPCQSFSHAGKRLGLKDARGGLMSQFARLISECEPKAFLVENVRGLATHDSGRTLTFVLELLGSGPYRLSHKILDASDYEVPQKRERIIIVGIRDDISEPYEFPRPSVKDVRLKDVLLDVPQSNSPSYSENKRKVMELVPEGGNWRDLPPRIQHAYMGKSIHSGGGKTGFARRLSMDGYSPTLTTSPSQKATETCHPKETRPLSVREYARIQTFPDSYGFVGSVADQYRQIGNAVPVNMACHLARSLRRILG